MRRVTFSGLLNTLQLPKLRFWRGWSSRQRKQVMHIALVVLALGSACAVILIMYRLGWFSKGVVIINADKPVYVTGETALLQISGVRDDNSPACDASYTITIDVPGKWRHLRLGTKQQSLQHLPSCLENAGTTSEPDAIARLLLEKSGTYKATVVNDRTHKRSSISFRVSDSQPVVTVARSGAHHVVAGTGQRYPVIVTVASRESFSGMVTAYVPSDFDLIWYGTATVEDQKKTSENQLKKLHWEVAVEPGKPVRLVFEYSVPKQMLGAYSFGELIVAEHNGKELLSTKTPWRVLVQPATDNAKQ